MPVKKGTGLDDIQALFLKSAATPLSDSIVKICSVSIFLLICTDTFPYTIY